MTIRKTAALAVSGLLAALAGCEEFGRTGGPTGNEAQQAADAMNPAPAAAPANAPAPAPQAGEAQAPPPGPPVGEQSGTHVGQKTKEILNVQELSGDPNWTVIASDPTQVRGFSAPGTAYNRAAALAGTANLEQWIKQEQALNGSFPSYQALLDYIAQNPVDMPALREYQHYGYDATTGEVVILENQQEKTARRNELGLSPNE